MSRFGVAALVAVFLACASLTGASSALAAPPPEPPPLIPPAPIHREPARYPAGATGAANVVLELVVKEDGTVGDVLVREGAEPFAAAAIEAVKAYRFEPAKRGDRVVSARIRVVVEFTPEADVPVEPKPEAAPPLQTIPPPPPPERVDEVRIAGTRLPPPSSPMEHRMARADIRLVPGAFGDPFRAIDALPGVVPTVSGLPYYYIRGAPPSAVGYFIDDVRVPYLFHFALGPGVIQPALVEEVSLHPAGFPARYGRYAGAIVAGRTRDPATELYGEGNIRIFDAGAYVETPLAKGRASVGLGGRYSYTGALFSLVAKDTTINYRDYNARASYEINDKWRASLLTLGSFDYASQIQYDDFGNGTERVFFASEFHRADLRLDRRGDDGAESRIGMTFGLDRTRIEGARFAQDFVFGVRARHRAPITRTFDLEVGADAMLDHYTGDVPSEYAVQPEEYAQARAFFSPRTESATGAWVSGRWHREDGFDVTATARADVFTSVGAVEVGPSPRLTTRLPVGDKTRILGVLGVAPQTPAFAIPVPAIGYRGLPGGLGFGWQKSAGVERDLPLKFLFKGMAFHHSYFNLRDFARNQNDFSFDEPQPVPNSPAQAYGLELYLSRRLSERIGGFVAYTLSRSVIGSTEIAKERVSPFDRTHVFQVGGAVYIGAGWRTSARFLTYRGWPDEGEDATPLRPPTRRLPAFYRVDARIEKRWKWRKDGYISLVIEALNASAQQEIVSRNCNTFDESGQQRCRDEKIGPIVAPSIGVEGAL
ncbi:MAG: TonB family protein [Labilithrix sp.]|nr:TonB family protein [Labilithrix sp.]MCW5815397.1 TonB family protein [Labilithrix sp.]